jgi:hypothetical protein
MDKVLVEADAINFGRAMKDFDIIPGFFSSDECKKFISLFENSEEVKRLSTRNRLMFHSPNLAQQIWDRVCKFIDPNFKYVCELGDTWEPHHINERFRLVKYDKNDKFDLHEDAQFVEDYNMQSFATVMVYLNDVPEENNGGTKFIDHGITLQPKEGLGVVFHVDGIMHYGEELKDGVKYIFRTDLIYKCHKMKDVKMKKELHNSLNFIENIPDEDLNTKESIKAHDNYYYLKTKYSNC